eukprot:11221108-Lingulodinium_polyedra.AAC.1
MLGCEHLCPDRVGVCSGRAGAVGGCSRGIQAGTTRVGRNRAFGLLSNTGLAGTRQFTGCFRAAATLFVPRGNQITLGLFS